MLLPVIMAGGTGSRLWPMSRELYPKQVNVRVHLQRLLASMVIVVPSSI